MKRIFVSNIPVRTVVDGWVEVPEDTTEENLDAAITVALREKGFRPETTEIEVEGLDLDKEALDAGWEFSTPLDGGF
jgi:hypothetical protein